MERWKNIAVGGSDGEVGELERVGRGGGWR
jgi:hypothetical protein